MPGKKNLNEEELKAIEEAEAFSEGDISDDSEGRRRRRKRRGAHDANQRKLLITDQYVPNSLKRLRACVFCKLVLNVEKWNKLEMCPNCPDSRGIQDTTDCFESVVSLILPKKSWVADWCKMVNHIPGLYALAISAHDDRSDANEYLDDDEDFA